MAEDIKNLRLSRRASNIANRLKEDGGFEDALSAAKFGMAYAIKYYKKELNQPECIERLNNTYDSHGLNYNVGSVDPDNFISRFIKIMYPGNETPYRYARVLMCYGLSKIGDLLDNNDFYPVYQNM